MQQDWQELSKITQGNIIEVERVRLSNSGIAIEGRFALPPLAQLSYEDQVFVMAFVKNHGSIKEMEQTFGVSYPTIKNRLNRISEKFSFTEIDQTPGVDAIVEKLGRGEIAADVAIELLRAKREKS